MKNTREITKTFKHIPTLCYQFSRNPVGLLCLVILQCFLHLLVVESYRGGLADWGRLPIRTSKTCCRPAEALTVPACGSFLYGNSVIIQFENDIARHIADATDVDLHMT